jgi:peptide/nickel transport system permease protein
MILFTLRRLIGFAVTLLLAALVIFYLLDLLPGDPAQFILGINASADAVAALRTQLGLDAPAPERFIGWLGGMLQGDFGLSYTQRAPVAAADRRHGSPSPCPLDPRRYGHLHRPSVFPSASSPPAGAARSLDTGLMVLAQFGRRGAELLVRHAADAALCGHPALAAAGRLHALARDMPGAPSARWSCRASRSPCPRPPSSRASCAPRWSTCTADYIRTARAKGLTMGEAVWRHGVRNALLPVLTILGLQFAFLVAGTIIVENVFYLPGLGRLIFTAISERDLILVRGAIDRSDRRGHRSPCSRSPTFLYGHRRSALRTLRAR